MAARPDWAAIADRVTRIRNGDRDRESLSEGMDRLGRWVVHQVIGDLEDTEPVNSFTPPVDAVVALAVSAARHRRDPGRPAPDPQKIDRVRKGLSDLDDPTLGPFFAQLVRLIDGSEIEWNTLDQMNTALMAIVEQQIEAKGDPS
jgi:hypothetical protein